ncbi:MAG: GNAT family N-acetyltransferase [Nitrososphaerota archaeon]|nr:GNAT family N-acetyltransferase [Candidatus Bathyarchaeota archaeon]MDW8048929.1 GNAT family N-acetyltransferase [Nitrososphaerota archaeon]
MLRIEKIDEDTFLRVPDPCRRCIYWQTVGEFNSSSMGKGGEEEKMRWLKRVLREFGCCIKVACLGDVIGVMQYAPAIYFPRVREYISGPPNEDAAFIACLYILDKDQRGKGYGTLMLKNLTEELKEKGFIAVETFARISSENNPSGPLTFYLRNNFKVVRRKDDFPLVRLELK